MKNDFLEYLEHKLDLSEIFIYGTHKTYNRQSDKHIFKEEFTYDNWKVGKIGRRLYKTGFKANTPVIFGEVYKEDDSKLFGHEYAIYRGIPYNFKVKQINYKK